MSAVSVSESGVRPILAEAVELARRALLELQPTGVGEHLGVTAEDECAATHHFRATLPGYRGWQWAVVVAAPPEAEYATVSESALLPGPDALVAPDFVPWDQRVRPGDLAPGDLLAPPADDPRLVPGYVVTDDPVVDDVAEEIGLGRPQVLSREGRAEAAERWYAEYGPDTDMARSAPSTCGVCGFFVPLAGALRAAFGVCANAMGADGHVVHTEYGCGAHSDTTLPTGGGSPLYEAYDDASVELIPTADLRPEAPTPESANTPAPEANSTAEVAPEAEALRAEGSAPEATDAPVAEEPSPEAAPVAETTPESANVPAPEADSAEVIAAEAEAAPAEGATPEATNAPVAEDASAERVASEGEGSPETEAAPAEGAAPEATNAPLAEEPSPEQGAAGGEDAPVAEVAPAEEATPEAVDAPVAEAGSGEQVAAEDSGTDEAEEVALQPMLTAEAIEEGAGHYHDAWAVSAVRVEPGERPGAADED
ncbi:DUF3027 domain-containing protein [Nocardia sp. NPDC004068]|uniref:DUF3027 domain-containing protein n=1 Tax=Nocardia sp. NPDC004068 TaxID=3364303 RepID=UPI00368F2F79